MMSDEPRYIEFLRESNAIEGVYDETSLFNAQQAWKYLIVKKKIGVATILKAHAILMANTDLQPDEKGKFRTCEVRVGMHFGLNYMLVPGAMKEWVEEANVRAFDLDEVKKQHVGFERIHPFVDGNGRIGRMLMNWQVCHHLRMMPMVIKEAERGEYYQWFR